MNITGLHIEPTNICTLKCPGCARTRFINQWPKHWKNSSLDIDALITFLDIDLTDLPIQLCGNYGDPIYHPEFSKLVMELKKRGSKLWITTNGSYRTHDWWKDVCQHLDSSDVIEFSIDGVPDNFDQYRINADWPSILVGIDVCTRSTAKTMWKYIPFAFNVSSIDQARELSLDLGIDEFRIEYSDRFDEKTQALQPVESLLHPRKSKQDNVKSGIKQPISPKCHKGHTHYISATGHYLPCCFVGDHRFYYKTDFGKNQPQYKIDQTTLTNMLLQKNVVEFYRDIVQDAPVVCQYNCPKID